jgi:hypothetical protein
MFNIGKDIPCLTDLKRYTSVLVAQLHDTKRAVVLTINGLPRRVGPDPSVWALQPC